MFEQFKPVRFSDQSRDRIDKCNEIIEAYQAQGLRLTLRQLYYQLVTRNVITNEEKSYKNLGSLIADARMAGLVDWSAIEDRVRQPREQAEWPSIQSLVRSAVRSFRLPRWAGQRYYSELWVEKDALAGVLEPLASQFHVTLMVNRGYSSASAMYESARRFIEACKATDDEMDTLPFTGEATYEGEEVPLVREPVLFYLGDHDPSGEDMVRDVRDRLQTFGVEVDVQKIALTTVQVKRYNPPPNPAKMSDSRAAAYVAKHGRSSWEVDALPPEVLSQVVRDSFAGVLNVELMQKVIAREKIDTARLVKAADALGAETL